MDRIVEADNMLSEASRNLYRSRTLLKELDYSGAVEASQHAIELSVKALYVLVGHEIPMKHEFENFREVMRLIHLPPEYSYFIESLGRVWWISTMWSFAHNVALYGYGNLPAGRLFNKRDAEVALEYASEVESSCRNIWNFVRNGVAKV